MAKIEEENGGNMSDKHYSILLVEDNKGDARLIQEVLRELPGYGLKCLETLSEALDEIKTQKYDAAIVDLGLPDSQGLETPAAIIEISPFLPVIVLTGHDDDQLAYQSIKKGAQDYLVKGSFNHELLGRTIRYAIERKRIEAELKKARDFAENLIETANVLVVGLDLQGNVIIFNNAAEKVTGYSREEVLNRNWLELFVPEDVRNQVGGALEKLRQSGPHNNFEHKIITKSKGLRQISWQNNGINDCGKTVGTISFGKDMTEIMNLAINTFLV
jgi:PAS domain S-box-containing protein